MRRDAAALGVTQFVLQPLDVGDPARDQARVRELPDPHRDIEALGDDVDRALLQHEVDGNGWVPLEERPHTADERVLAEDARAGDAQMTARGGLIGVQRALELLDLPNDPGAAGVVGGSDLGGVSLRVVRLSRRTPSRCSSWPTYLLASAFEIPSRRAASEKLPASTTRA
jgi:hypothetical protein